MRGRGKERKRGGRVSSRTGEEASRENKRHMQLTQIRKVIATIYVAVVAIAGANFSTG